MSVDRQDPPHIPNAQYIRHLGSGGFADVFLYRQSMPERDIAVKVLRSDASVEQNGAFEAEANLMAKMSTHPSILSVLGAGVSKDGRSYLVMEYCPSNVMGRKGNHRRLSVPRVLDIGIRLAGAVETLHHAGILHRDIKPANILVTQFGHPVLTDFGIAVSTGSGADKSDTGFSIPWAPREQILSDPNPGPTLDIYSLAATIYTFLVGHSPFEIPGGDNREITVINRVQNNAVPRTGRKDVPLELERVLAIAMAKDPSQRYPSALDFAHALQQIQADLHERATPMDVLESGSAEQVTDDEDATRARPIQIVDPHQTQNDEAVSELNLSGSDSISEQTESSAMPDSTDVSVPSDSAVVAAAGPQFVLVHDPKVDDLLIPVEEPSPSEENPAASPTSLPHNARRRITGLLAGVMALGILAFGGWALLRGEGASFSVTDKPTDGGAVGLPVTTTVEGVTDLSGSIEGGKVRFSWDFEGDNPSFLYSLVDPIENHQVRETSEKSVVVDPVEGRTCLQVVVRDATGKTSTPATECVETP